MKVLHIVPAFYPATYWGGPILSVYELCNSLSRQNDRIKLRVLTTDSAGPTTKDSVPYSSVPAKYEAGYSVYFSRRLIGSEFSPMLIFRIITMSKWADIIHVTSVYSLSTFISLIIARLRGKPIVWSPRGALQRWDRSTNSFIKSAWDILCNCLVDSSRSILHVTSKEEADASRNRIPKAKIILIPNGVTLPPVNTKVSRGDGILRLLYIGRLHEIKGLENLFKAMKMLPDNIELSVCGNGDASYVKGLRNLVSDLDLNSRVKFRGHITGDDKEKELFDADICIVPSYIENFGMVIVEAMAHGVPVIVSNGTPWEEINKKGCGLWVENSPSSLADAVIEISEKNYLEMGSKGRAWMEESYSWTKIASQMEDLYDKINYG